MTSTQPVSRIATFPPTWGSMAMTISGTAMVSLLGPLPGSEIDYWVGLGFLAMSWLVVLILSVIYGWKLLGHWSQFRADLFHPGQGAQTASWPAALLISALATSQAGMIGLLDARLALVVGVTVGSLGLIGTALSGFGFFSHVIGQRDIPAQAITAGWFVPVVPLVLVPSISLRLSALADTDPPEFLVWLGVSAWGIGFGLFMLLAAIIGGRLLMLEPPSAHALPSWWAWLAPLGAGGLGIVTSTRLIGDESLVSVAYWLAAAVWGFSAWWVIFAAVIILRARADAKFHLGYWGFGFPTAAFSSLSLEVGRHHGFVWLEWVSVVFWLGLIALVAWLTIRSVSAAKRGELSPAGR